MDDDQRAPLDLQQVVQELQWALQEAEQLDGTNVSPVRAEEAARHRRLLNLADVLDLASALVKNEYWYSRGGRSLE